MVWESRLILGVIFVILGIIMSIISYDNPSAGIFRFYYGTLAFGAFLVISAVYHLIVDEKHYKEKHNEFNNTEESKEAGEDD